MAEADKQLRLLHLEDDAVLGVLVGSALHDAGFVVDASANTADGFALVEQRRYDLALVDWRLPGAMDGLAFARWLKAYSPNIGIVMLSVLRDIEFRRQALDEACDDYLVKPCEMTDLVARLRALARRTSRPPSPVLEWGPFQVDLIRGRAWVDGQEVQGLQPTQIRFLGYLVQNAGRICTHEELSQVIFGSKQHADSTSRSRVVSVLRARCGQSGRHIVTVDGIGYGIGIDEL